MVALDWNDLFQVVMSGLSAEELYRNQGSEISGSQPDVLLIQWLVEEKVGRERDVRGFYEYFGGRFYLPFPL